MDNHSKCPDTIWIFQLFHTVGVADFKSRLKCGLKYWRGTLEVILYQVGSEAFWSSGLLHGRKIKQLRKNQSVENLKILDLGGAQADLGRSQNCFYHRDSDLTLLSLT